MTRVHAVIAVLTALILFPTAVAAEGGAITFDHTDGAARRTVTHVAYDSDMQARQALFKTDQEYIRGQLTPKHDDVAVIPYVMDWRSARAAGVDAGVVMSVWIGGEPSGIVFVLAAGSDLYALALIGPSAEDALDALQEYIARLLHEGLDADPPVGFERL